MGLLEIARETLKEIPMSDILRERLSLALDQSAEAQRQITALQTENGKVQAQLEIERANHQKMQQELKALQETWSEEVRIKRMIEFRRGRRTGGVWAAFCPKCHVPAMIEGHPFVRCTDGGCEWSAMVPVEFVRKMLEEM